MANAALENLSAAGTVAGTDLVPIKQAGATLLKGTVNQLATGILSGDAVASAGTANGILYLNGSKVASSGSGLQFNGNTLTLDADLLLGSTGRYIYQTGSAHLSLQTGTGHFVWLRDNGASEAMRLTATGLGIGTSSPGAKLHVAGIGKNSIFGSITANNAYSAWQYNSGDVGYIGNGAAVVSGAGLTDFGITSFTGGKLWLGTNNGANYAVIDASGNLGLGVTPSASWYSSVKAMQLGSTGAVLGRTNNEIVVLASNAYNSGASTADYAYLVSANYATRYQQDSGNHKWYTAPSGTAGAAISFTQAMTLDASGNLGVGVTSPSFTAGSGLHIYRTSGAALKLEDASTNFDILAFGANVSLSNRSAGAMGFITNGTERARFTAAGDFIHQVNATAPTLSTNSTMSFELTSNTSLKIVVCGSDNVTRSVSLTLA